MNSEIAVRIGKNIATARRKHGRTQADVAETVGMDTVSLSRIERGVVTTQIGTLEKIAAELQVPLSRLFDGASTASWALADNIRTHLAPLRDEDRLFLLKQVQIWAERLGKDRE